MECTKMHGMNNIKIKSPEYSPHMPQENEDLHKSRRCGSQALISDATCLRMLLEELLFVRVIPERL